MPNSFPDSHGDNSTGPGQERRDPFSALRQSAEEGPSTPERSRLPLAILAALAAVLVVGLGVFFLSGGNAPSPDVNASTQQNRLVAVPSVVGLTQAAAEAKIAAAGLSVGEVTSEVSDKYQPGFVLRQGPAAGRGAEPGDAVSLVLVEAPLPTVPNLIGLTEFAAVNALLQSGLALGSTSEENSEKAAGEVIKQSIAAGVEVDPGTSVNVVLSNGKVLVPEVTDLSRSAATIALENAGFVVEAQSTEADPGDRVLSTSPTGGTYADPGTTVVILIPESVSPSPSESPSQSPKPSPGPQCSSLNFTLQIQEEAQRRGIPFIGLNDFRCVGNWAAVQAQFGFDPYIYTEVFAVKKGKTKWDLVPTATACAPGGGLPPSLYSRVCQ